MKYESTDTGKNKHLRLISTYEVDIYKRKPLDDSPCRSRRRSAGTRCAAEERVSQE